MKQKRAAQVPMLIKLREEAKARGTDTKVKLVADKLMVNSVLNTEAFEKNRLDVYIFFSYNI